MPDSNVKKSFTALLITQFFGALNDNIFKIVFSLYAVHTLAGLGSSSAKSIVDNEIFNLVVINSCFVLPFIVFARFAGSLSDRMPKNIVIRKLKIVELILMLIAATCFYFNLSSALFLVLFLMGTQSTFFSPAKFGILPEYFSGAEISKANGYVEFWTFIAIILGTILAGPITYYMRFQPLIPGITLISFAVLGLYFSLKIARTPSECSEHSQSESNGIFKTLTAISKHRGLLLSLIGITFFWTIGLVYQLNLILYAKNLSNLDEIYSSTFLLALGLGIGMGSLLAGKISEGHVELGLVPLGAFGLTVGGLILFFSPKWYFVCLVTLFVTGLSAGIFIVPLQAYFQFRSPPEIRGSYLAALNFCSFSGMLLAGIALYVGSALFSLQANHIFLFCAILTIGVTVYLIRLLPEILMRCINWILIHTFYNVKVYNSENIPKKGGALLVCNHVSYIDAQLILASISRPVRYLMYKPIYELPLVNPVAKAMGTIPIQAGSNREEIEAALQAATTAIRSGELVCIFAEGGITRTGELNPFKRGLESIMKDSEAPIIPVALRQLWGSIFSYSEGKFLFKMPKKIPYPMEIEFGQPLDARTSAEEVREKVVALLEKLVE